jgi:hypothetical protein
MDYEKDRRVDEYVAGLPGWQQANDRCRRRS